MSSIYGAGFANFTPNVLGTQELTTAIQSAISSTGTTSRTNEDLILETKTANNVVVKANNTTVATFSADPTTDPRLTLSGTSPDLIIDSNSAESTVTTFPGLRINNANNSKNLYLGVAGGTNGNPTLGTNSSAFGFLTNNIRRMVLKGNALQLYSPTAFITLDWQNTLNSYTLDLPTSLGAKNTVIGNGNSEGSLTFQRCPIVLYGSYHSDTTTGTTKEIVRSVTIPANTLSENSMLRFIMIFEKTGNRSTNATSVDLDINGMTAFVTHTITGDTVLSTRLQYEGFMQNNLTAIQTLRQNNVSVNMSTAFNIIQVNHATNPITFNVSLTDPVAGCTTLRYFSIVML